jgi:hypothetical protein
MFLKIKAIPHRKHNETVNKYQPTIIIIIMEIALYSGSRIKHKCNVWGKESSLMLNRVVNIVTTILANC